MASELFHVVDDAQCILAGSNGVYRQAKVYRRGNALYAGYGSGFVRLYKTGTSVPSIRVEALIGVTATYDGLGRAVAP